MTLVVAGFEDNGTIVFCADSLITTRKDGISIKLTSSFRKIVPLEVIVQFPEFSNDGVIVRYINTTSSHRCMIAFAGSTLVSQHIINNIQGHLRSIKVTFEEPHYKNNIYIEGKFKLKMGCEDDKKVLDTRWDEDIIWPQSNASELLNKDFFSKLFKHCIQKNINEFLIEQNDFFNPDWFACEFICAISCYESKRNHLFTYKMEFSDKHANLIEKEIKEGDLAIIGIKRYNKKIIDSYCNSTPPVDVSNILFSELHEAVLDNENADLREIGFPIIQKKFDQYNELRDNQKHRGK